MTGDLKVAAGFKLPPDGPLTENELVWISFLRLASRGTDPAITLPRAQGLQALFRVDACSRCSVSRIVDPGKEHE